MTYTYIGIDVSKDTLTIAYLNQNHWKKNTIPNTIEGIEKWLKSLDDESVHIIFEATGTYSSKLAYVLTLHLIRFSIVSPNQSSSYSKLKGNSTKNDDRDAQLLAEYGQQFHPKPSKIAKKEEEQLKQTLTALRGLEKSRQVFRNQLHAMEQLPIPDKEIIRTLNQTISFLDKKIAVLEKKTSNLLKSERLKPTTDLMLTVKGVGPAVVASIWAEIGNPLRFENPKQFAKFAGLTPIEYSSGKSHKRTPIPKRRGSKLRNNLYMAVLSAIQYNQPCKELFNRLRAKNKPERVVHWAVAHKLLRQVWGVVNSGRPFDNAISIEK